MRSTLITALFIWSSSGAQWTQLPDFPGSARDDAAAFSIDGKVYVGTGRDTTFALTNDWFAFDEINLEWNPIAPMPTTGRQYCAAFSDGTFGYVFGGVDVNGSLNELWRYDPALDLWEARAPLPAAGRYATVAFDSGLICTGLMEGGMPTNESWRYSMVSDTWTQKAPVPGPPRHRAAGGGSFELIAGGANASSEPLSDAYIYNYVSDDWSAVIDLPGARYGADGADGVVLCGASGPTEFHASAWFLYDANNWNTTDFGDFPGGERRGGTMVSTATEIEPWRAQCYYGTGTSTTERKRDWWRLWVITEHVEEHDRIALASFPNPTAGLLHIALPKNSGALNYELFDMTGRSVLTGIMFPGQSIDASQQQAGAYMVILHGTLQQYRTSFTLLPFE